MKLYKTLYKSPIGELLLCADETALHSIQFEPTAEVEHADINSILERTRQQLDSYFAGNLTEFDLPLKLDGTDFQKQVWLALTDVPYGHTASYKDIALKIGNPKAVRAVGGANNKNPVPIVIPCHRIIGSNKAMIGYAGGLWRKQFLLELETKQTSLHFQ